MTLYFLLPALALACGIAAITSRGPRVRARDARGRFLPDDPATPFKNEAYK